MFDPDKVKSMTEGLAIVDNDPRYRIEGLRGLTAALEFHFEDDVVRKKAVNSVLEALPATVMTEALDAKGSVFGLRPVPGTSMTRKEFWQVFKNIEKACRKGVIMYDDPRYRIGGLLGLTAVLEFQFRNGEERANTTKYAFDALPETVVAEALDEQGSVFGIRPLPGTFMTWVEFRRILRNVEHACDKAKIIISHTKDPLTATQGELEDERRKIEGLESITVNDDDERYRIDRSKGPTAILRFDPDVPSDVNARIEDISDAFKSYLSAGIEITPLDKDGLAFGMRFYVEMSLRSFNHIIKNLGQASKAQVYVVSEQGISRWN